MVPGRSRIYAVERKADFDAENAENAKGPSAAEPQPNAEDAEDAEGRRERRSRGGVCRIPVTDNQPTLNAVSTAEGPTRQSRNQSHFQERAARLEDRAAPHNKRLNHTGSVWRRLSVPQVPPKGRSFWKSCSKLPRKTTCPDIAGPIGTHFRRRLSKLSCSHKKSAHAAKKSRVSTAEKTQRIRVVKENAITEAFIRIANGIIDLHERATPAELRT